MPWSMRLEWLNDIEQIQQDYGFSSEWVTRCLFKWPAWVNDLEQDLHEKSFSPEWVTICLFKWLAWLNDLEQSSQVKCFSPECVTMCLFKLCDWVNDLEHISQVNGFFFWMIKHMILQTSSSIKWLWTKFTSEMFLSWMRFHVSL